MWKIVYASSVICCVKGTSIRLGKSATNIRFYIRVNICAEVSGYQKFQIAFSMVATSL
jgi:hypothetical protein